MSRSEIELGTIGNNEDNADFYSSDSSDSSDGLDSLYRFLLSPPWVRALIELRESQILIAVMGLIASFLDPLIFFGFSATQENNCIIMEYKVIKIIVSVRTIHDVVMMYGCMFVMLRQHCRLELTDKLDCLLAFPLPLIFVMGIPGHKGVDSAFTGLSVSVLLQYIPRLFRIIPLIVSQTSRQHIFHTAWANSLINFITFFLGAHTAGSFWYIMGFSRISECLRIACRDSNIENCGAYKDFRVAVLPTWKNYENATACFTGDNFPYGIFHLVPQLSNSSFGTRYLYSLFWGLQQISTLAGNLTPSVYGWEIVLTIAIIVIGLLLFAILLGNVQLILEAISRRKFDFYSRMVDVDRWMERKRVLQPTRREIFEKEIERWDRTEGINDEELFCSFPHFLQHEVQNVHDCFEKEEILRHMHPNVLHAIRKKLRRQGYNAGREIINPNDMVVEMVFVYIGTVKSIEANSTEKIFRPGKVYGMELLEQFIKSINNDDSTDCYINRTIECVTDVGAFKLKEKDVNNITNRQKKWLYPERIYFSLITEIELLHRVKYRVLNALCKKFRLRTYLEDALILDEGCKVTSIVFIAKGKVRSPLNQIFRPGAVLGAELLERCIQSITTQQRTRVVISETQMQCITKVEAYILDHKTAKKIIRRYITEFTNASQMSEVSLESN